MSNFDDLYNELTPEEKKLIYELYSKSHFEFSKDLTQMEQFIFKKPYPTPEQFLDPTNGWLPRQFTENIFDWVKQDFCDFLNKKKRHSHIIQYGATRTGKSTLAILLMMYCIVYVHHLRDMSAYYNLAGGTSLSLYILSFDYKKVFELYLKPLYNLMGQSERFQKIKFQDMVKPRQEEVGLDYVVYSKVSLVGHLTLASGLQLVSGNDDALAIIGANILAGFVSEIAFFIESAGATEPHIFRLYSDLVDRIGATVGKNYLGFVYLDTSANNSESMIENFILKDLSQRDDVYFRWLKRWDVKELVNKFYKVYKNTNETFPICIGDGTIPAKILENYEVSSYPNNLIIDVPVDLKRVFETNLIKSIKDIAGQPTTAESKFVQSKQLINNIFENEALQNIEGIITADSKETPEGLIWNKEQIQKLFVKYDGTHYCLRRCPKELRYIGVDLAHSVKGDIIGITMIHREMRLSGEIVNVCDFSFAIGPGENGINIEAIGHFIKDLAQNGNVPIRQINVDQFQSETLVQFLNRSKLTAIKSSVDREIAPYLYLYTCMLSGTVKAGKNIFLKNNIDSLYRIKKSKGTSLEKEKIDHSRGDLENAYYGDWEKSKSGMNAKDVSDSLVQCLFAMNEDDVYPVSIYEKQNIKESEKLSKVITRDVNFKNRLNEAMKVLHGSYH